MKKVYVIVFCLLAFYSCNKKSDEQLVVDWITNNAKEIKHIEAGNGFEDLKSIGEMVDEARIVLLGEPTHGNREVFQLKHRLVEYLVEEKGFNIFALECPFAEAYDINRYVMEGIGDPEKALAGIYIWTWDTEEVLELVEWIRRYNMNPDNEKKVKFYGFDTQDPERAARVMLDYLKKVDQQLEELIRPELGILEVPFSNVSSIGRRQYIPEEYDASSLSQIQKVMRAFENNKNTYISSSSHKEWEFAKHHARQIEIYILANINDGHNYGYERDQGQAENIKWALDYEGEDSKIIVWAHNIHVNNAKSPHTIKADLDYRRTEWMGSYMKLWYQGRVKIIGFFHNRGEFTALDEALPSQGLKTMRVDNAKNGSLEHMMVNANLTNAYLDLSKLPRKGPVFDWFNRPIPTRYSWGFYNESNSEEYYWPHNVTKEFDALIFLEKTTATVPIDKSDYEHLWLLNKQLDHPANLDFEENKVGEAPNGWITWSKFKRLDVIMTTSNEAHSGKKSLMVRRPEGPSYGEIGPNVLQSINAKPYRSKRILIRATAKANLGPSAFAFFKLLIEASTEGETHEGEPPLFDSLDQYRITSEDWKTYEIEVQVDENADIIHYGISLRDFGTLWFDSVEIEVVD